VLENEKQVQILGSLAAKEKATRGSQKVNESEPGTSFVRDSVESSTLEDPLLSVKVEGLLTLENLLERML